MIEAQSAPSPTRAAQPAARSTILRGWRLGVVRSLWLLVALSSVLTLILGVPSLIIQLRAEIQAMSQPITQLGISNQTILAFFLVVQTLSSTTFLVVAVLTGWGKTNDWVAIFVSITLLVTGAILPVTDTIITHSGVRGTLVDMLIALSNTLLLVFLYIFPTGQVVPRWGAAVILPQVAWALYSTLAPLAPFTIHTLAPNLYIAASLLLYGSGLAAQLYRYRCISDTLQRQQSKWVLYGIILAFLGMVVQYGILIFVPTPDQMTVTGFILSLGASLIASVSVSLIPLSIGISLMRYRLWDIDPLINRTLVYGSLTTFLAIMYFGSIFTLQGLFRLITGQQSDLALVASTLLIASLFQPLRDRFKTWIDRRFYRQKYNATRILTSFSTTLRDEVDLRTVIATLGSVVDQTLHPGSALLWARGMALETGLAHLTQIEIAPQDPLIKHLQTATQTMRVVDLHVQSPAVQWFKQQDVKLLVPLISQGELVGLLGLGPRLSGEDYVIDDRRFLTALAAQAAPVMRIAQLVRDQQAEMVARERMEQELRIAHLVQHTLLPKTIPDLPGWQIAASYQAARAVGGDFYDFMLFEDGRLFVVIGDVTGKGVPAALIMSTTRSLVRATARQALAPAQVLAEVNDLLQTDMLARMFVTCQCALIDPRTGTIEYANAGHNPIFRRRAGSIEELELPGLPLGIMPGVRYEQAAATLQPGDSLLFYSDGLVEAHNPQREIYGFPRLAERMAGSTSGVKLIDELHADLARFTGPAWEQEDDITLVALHWAAPPA